MLDIPALQVVDIHHGQVNGILPAIHHQAKVQPIHQDGNDLTGNGAVRDNHQATGRNPRRQPHFQRGKLFHTVTAPILKYNMLKSSIMISAVLFLKLTRDFTFSIHPPQRRRSSSARAFGLINLFLTPPLCQRPPGQRGSSSGACTPPPQRFRSWPQFPCSNSHPGFPQ